MYYYVSGTFLDARKTIGNHTNKVSVLIELLFWVQINSKHENKTEIKICTKDDSAVNKIKIE